MGVYNQKVELDVRFDSKEQVYHIGRLKAPLKLDLTDGATFLIFLSASGEEELQIACNDKENTTFSKYSKRNDRFKISLEDREDQHGQLFYVAKLQYNGYVDCSTEDGAVFIVFTSRTGSEELQIVGNIVSSDDYKEQKSDIEVLYK